MVNPFKRLVRVVDRGDAFTWRYIIQVRYFGFWWRQHETYMLESEAINQAKRMTTRGVYDVIWPNCETKEILR